MKRTPFVRVLGLALVTSGCMMSSDPVKENPPPPEPLPGNPPLPTPEPTALPTWDQVKSSHPEGATNPPRPLLMVSREPEACFKEWVGGMRPPDPEEAAIDGHVVNTPADAAHLGTQIQCPEGQPAKLLAAHKAWMEGGQKEPL